jgi:MFS family permease
MRWSACGRTAIARNSPSPRGRTSRPGTGSGITLGTTISANQTALYTQAGADQIGTATGLFRTFGLLGSIASSALISLVFHIHVNDHHLHVIALIMVIVSGLGLVIVLTDRKIMRPRARDRAPSLPATDARAR